MKDDAPILFLSEKGELLKLNDEDEPEAVKLLKLNDEYEPEEVEELCGKVIVDFVRNADLVAILTDEGTVYLWW
jgi:hypothetical protein